VTNWEGTIKKVSDEMTIGGVPPPIIKPWFINPGLTLSVSDIAPLVHFFHLTAWTQAAPERVKKPKKGKKNR